MRKTYNSQMKLGEILIKDVKINLESRDEIPKILMGLKHIYINKTLRDKIFRILEKAIPDAINPNTGRPGMYLWTILVLGVIRLNCNWDYDKLQEIANNHKIVRQMLGHGLLMNEYETDDGIFYPLTTIKDNVPLLTREILDEINIVVVEAGHEILGESDTDLKGRCDSFVVETDVHFPTDANLAWDAIRTAIRIVAMLCSFLGIQEWRQYSYHLSKIKGLYLRIQRLRRSTSKNQEKKDERNVYISNCYQEYIDLLEDYVRRIKVTIEIIRNMGLDVLTEIKIQEIEYYISHTERQIEQMRRRAIEGETIPHDEKIFSVFEEHTEWISKGKAGVPVELGLRVCVLEDQHGFILNHKVMEKQTDDKVALPIVEEAKEKFPNLTSCSFDKGFYTPENREKLGMILDGVILPKKGKLTGKNLEIERTDEFIEGRKQHSAIESAINALENHGLDRCPDHGLEGFKRYVSLGVLARNIQILGNIVQTKEQKSKHRREKIQRTWDEKGLLKAA